MLDVTDIKLARRYSLEEKIHSMMSGVYMMLKETLSDQDKVISPGSDKELFDAYRKAYSGLDDIKVDVKSPNGTYNLGSDVALSKAVDLIEVWRKEQGLM
ncbi:hypothetical protein [Mangrovibacter plantisponsor]|uniref:Uncharacterized protein n=1 Tax=Mangrovibacter plantisponsor TaxID=451513 RepID=A0A317PJH2_9ENTR|nr:hypothetical protein [Mangrovibacter plantisponsor]PWV98709.1 hypothetical protein DES37_1365 [Mangrovibacter plantisponsor]